MRRIAASLMVVATVAGGAGAQDEPQPPLPEVAAALERIQAESTIELSTVGRKTGKLHTRPVWFVVDDGRIVVQAGKDGKTDWYRNLAKKPEANVRQAGYTFRVKATPVTDPAEVERIHRLFADKYTLAWLGSFVGSSLGRGQPVSLAPEAVAVSR